MRMESSLTNELTLRQPRSSRLSKRLLKAVFGLLLVGGLEVKAACSLYQVQAQAATNDPTTTCADYPVPFDDADYLDGAGASLLTPATPLQHLQLAFLPPCVDGSASCVVRDRIRAVDGTRPFLYFDVDADSDQQAATPVQPSNKWVFFFQGGKQCGQAHPYDNPVEPCLALYQSARSEVNNMTSAYPGSNGGVLQHTYAAAGNFKGGILNDQDVAPRTRGNRFRNHNRVFMYKLSMDAQIGDRENVANISVPGQGMVRVRTFHPPVDTNLPGRSGDNPLPSLANAEEIIIAAQSMGTFGLIHNIKFIADLLRDEILPQGSTARIKFVLDANFPPSNAIEQSFDNYYLSQYDFRSPDENYTGESLLHSDDGQESWYLSRSHAYFSEPGVSPMRNFYDSWGRIADGETGNADCIAFFDDSDTNRTQANNWRCYDHLWVLTNFIQEDVFIHFNQQDQAILAHDSTYAVDNDNGGVPFNWLSYEHTPYAGAKSYLNAASGRMSAHALSLLCLRHNAISANVLPQLAFYLMDDNDHTSVCQDKQFGSAQGRDEQGNPAGYRMLARADDQGNPVPGTAVTFMQALSDWVMSDATEMAWIDDNRFDATTAEMSYCGTIDEFVNWRSFNLEHNESGGEF